MAVEIGGPCLWLWYIVWFSLFLTIYRTTWGKTKRKGKLCREAEEKWQILFCRYQVRWEVSLCLLHPTPTVHYSLSFFLPIKILPLFTFFFHFNFFLNLGALPGGSGSSSGGGGGPVILELPLDKIRRPLMRTRANDPNKVQELMDSISQIGLQVPVSIWSLMQFFQLYSEYLCMAFGVYLFLLYWVRPLFALWENEGKVRVFGFCVLWFMRIHWM